MKELIFSLILVVLGVLMTGYGLMVCALRTGSKFWMIWEVLGVFFITVFILIKTHMIEKIPMSIKGFVCVLFGLGIVIVIICLVCIFSSFSSKGSDNLDYILVLGAQVNENGPRRVLKSRLDAGIEYMEKNPDCKCIVSGGRGENEPTTEAETMKKYMVEKGISPDRIIEEDRSFNTTENMMFSKDILEQEGYKNVGVVTSNFHLFRAMGLARKQGLKNVDGISAESYPFYLPNNIFRECFGIVKDKVFGNM